MSVLGKKVNADRFQRNNSQTTNSAVCWVNLELQIQYESAASICILSLVLRLSWIWLHVRNQSLCWTVIGKNCLMPYMILMGYLLIRISTRKKWSTPRQSLGKAFHASHIPYATIIYCENQLWSFLRPTPGPKCISVSSTICTCMLYIFLYVG